jgi:hypothetical protein
MRKAKALEEKDINNPFIVVNNLFVLSPGPGIYSLIIT